MKLAVALRGCGTLTEADFAAAVAGWRLRGSPSPPTRVWWVAQPTAPDILIGSPQRVLVLLTGIDTQIMPGNQGLPAAPPARTTAVTAPGVSGRHVLVDARCLVRLPSPASACLWEFE